MRWVEGFAARHGAPAADVQGARLVLAAPDGASAELAAPYPPVPELPTDPAAAAEVLAAHAALTRRTGVLLVRRGGHAAGVFTGATLEGGRAGSRHVQGRTAAGGWSQQRFARRREGQARVAYAAAADLAAAVLVPEAATLAALVTGGDRRSCELVLEDPRLAVLRPLVSERRLDVPEPRRAVLEECGPRLVAVRVLVREP